MYLKKIIFSFNTLMDFKLNILKNEWKNSLIMFVFYYEKHKNLKGLAWSNGIYFCYLL